HRIDTAALLHSHLKKSRLFVLCSLHVFLTHGAVNHSTFAEISFNRFGPGLAMPEIAQEASPTAGS
ncbi:MAG: hypothetical protein ACLQU4_00455, partial [Limisphaerales bacterium]